jgi:hypothetical protein
MKTFTVSIRKPLATGATVTVTVVSSSPSDFTASPASFVITSKADVQVVTITFVDDEFEEPDVEDSNILTLTFTSAGDPVYNGRTITIPVTVVDNNVAAARFEFTKLNGEKRKVPSASMLTSKGTAVDFNVVLLSQPTAAVNLTVSQKLETRAGQSNPTVTLTPATLLFHPGDWNKAQLVKFTPVSDDVRHARSTFEVTITSSSADPYYSSDTSKGVSPLGTLSLPEAMVEVVDAGPEAALAVGPVGLVIKEGDTQTIHVALTSRPLHPVTVACAVLNGGMDTDIKVNVTSLLFQPTQWNKAQVVGVLAVEDTRDELADESSTITFTATSTDPQYQGAQPAKVTVAVVNSMDNIRVVKLDTRLCGLSPDDFDSEKQTAFRNATALMFGIPIDDITIVKVRATNGQGSSRGSSSGSNATADACTIVSYEMRTENIEQARTLEDRILKQGVSDWTDKLMEQDALKGAVTGDVLPVAAPPEIDLLRTLESVTYLSSRIIPSAGDVGADVTADGGRRRLLVAPSPSALSPSASSPSPSSVAASSSPPPSPTTSTTVAGEAGGAGGAGDASVPALPSGARAAVELTWIRSAGNPRGLSYSVEIRHWAADTNATADPEGGSYSSAAASVARAVGAAADTSTILQLGDTEVYRNTSLEVGRIYAFRVAAYDPKSNANGKFTEWAIQSIIAPVAPAAVTGRRPAIFNVAEVTWEDRLQLCTGATGTRYCSQVTHFHIQARNASGYVDLDTFYVREVK